MKRNLLFALLCLTVFTVQAQEQDVKVKFEREPVHEKDVYGGWYNFGQMIYDAIGNSNYYRNALFPDSSVQVEFSNGFGYVWKHSMGQVFDPADDNWAIGGIVPIDATDPYTVDSIRIWYRYFRHQTTNPDTLRVQVFTESAMSTHSDPWSNGQSYATTDYDYTTNLAVNPSQDYTILLGDSDTSMAFQNVIPLEIDMDVPAGEIIGVNVTYFPGNAHNFGDTIDQYITVPPVNQINAFYMYNFRDNDEQHSTDFYNHGWLIPSSIRYNENPQGWNGSYYPSIAYFNVIDHSDIDFHVVGTVGIDEKENEAFSVHPNPANNLLNIRFNDEQTAETIKVTDLAGKDVTAATRFNGSALNVISLAEGQYLISLTVDGNVSTQRFVVKH